MASADDVCEQKQPCRALPGRNPRLLAGAACSRNWVSVAALHILSWPNQA
jgi:hypothetical protein